jgi:hypothetical protein
VRRGRFSAQSPEKSQLISGFLLTSSDAALYLTVDY